MTTTSEMPCSHVLWRSDGIELPCTMSKRDHSGNHRGMLKKWVIFWRTKESGKWRVDGDPARAVGHEAYVRFADKVRCDDCGELFLDIEEHVRESVTVKAMDFDLTIHKER